MVYLTLGELKQELKKRTIKKLISTTDNTIKIHFKNNDIGFVITSMGATKRYKDKNSANKVIYRMYSQLQPVLSNI